LPDNCSDVAIGQVAWGALLFDDGHTQVAPGSTISFLIRACGLSLVGKDLIDPIVFAYSLQQDEDGCHTLAFLSRCRASTCSSSSSTIRTSIRQMYIEQDVFSLARYMDMLGLGADQLVPANWWLVVGGVDRLMPESETIKSMIPDVDGYCNALTAGLSDDGVLDACSSPVGDMCLVREGGPVVHSHRLRKGGMFETERL